jgi:F-type H+/Na+-transporting ATPase subunit alpha
MTELLKQGQYQPLSVENQVLILYAVTTGFADNLPVESLQRYERELYAFVSARHQPLWDELRAKGNDSKSWDALQARMKTALGEFAKEFAPDAAAAA